MATKLWWKLGLVVSAGAMLACSGADDGGAEADFAGSTAELSGSEAGAGVEDRSTATHAGEGSGPEAAGNSLAASGVNAASAAGAKGAPKYVSNTPGAMVTQVASPEVDGLVVVSSNLTDAPSDSHYVRRWTGLVYNGGTKIACFPKVTALFYSGDAEVAAFFSFVDSAPHSANDAKASIPCLQPGATGAFHVAEASPDPLPEVITDVTFELDGVAYEGAALHPSEPIVSEVAPTQPYAAGTGYWAAQGSMTATDTIHDIYIISYPVSADGLVLEPLAVAHADTVSAGSSYTFETKMVDGAPAAPQHLTFVSFVDGTSDIVTTPPSPDAASNGEDLGVLSSEAVTIEQNQTLLARFRSHRAAMLQRLQTK